MSAGGMQALVDEARPGDPDLDEYDAVRIRRLRQFKRNC